MVRPTSFEIRSTFAERERTLELTRPTGQVLSVVELTGADAHLPFRNHTERS